jgi:hypothetical protein
MTYGYDERTPRRHATTEHPGVFRLFTLTGLYLLSLLILVVYRTTADNYFAPKTG